MFGYTAACKCCAEVAEQADATVSNTVEHSAHVGSIPTFGTQPDSEPANNAGIIRPVGKLAKFQGGKRELAVPRRDSLLYVTPVPT